MHYENESVDVLLSAQQIDTRLQEMAQDIMRDYAGQTITLVCTLTGGVIFLADLARKLGNNVHFDFVRAASYGSGTSSSGHVKVELPPGLNLTGKQVLIVEDIIDSGHTLSKITQYLAGLGAADIKIAALLDKPDRREVHGIKVDYLGFTIPDAFVVGYGLDYDQRYRNLPYVGVLRFGGQ